MTDWQHKAAELAGLLRLGLELAEMPVGECSDKWLTWAVMVRRVLNLETPANASPEYLEAVKAVELVQSLADDAKTGNPKMISIGAAKKRKR